MLFVIFHYIAALLCSVSSSLPLSTFCCLFKCLLETVDYTPSHAHNTNKTTWKWQISDTILTSSGGSIPTRPGSLLFRTLRKAGGVSGGRSPLLTALTNLCRRRRASRVVAMIWRRGVTRYWRATISDNFSVTSSSSFWDKWGSLTSIALLFGGRKVIYLLGIDVMVNFWLLFIYLL